MFSCFGKKIQKTLLQYGLKTIWTSLGWRDIKFILKGCYCILFLTLSIFKTLKWCPTFDGFATVWPEPIWIKVKEFWLLLPQHQSKYPRGPEYASIGIYLSDPNLPHIVKQDLLKIKNSFWKFYVWKGAFNWCRFWVS